MRASEDIQNREGKVEDGQWKKEIEGHGWYEKENEERFQEQTRKKDRSEMRMPANMMRCTLLNGSAWSAEKTYMRTYKGASDIFSTTEASTRASGSKKSAFSLNRQKRECPFADPRAQRRVD